jgi:4-amino-4-deoxy-L-arabinose transferase-like glycosyltransferase
MLKIIKKTLSKIYKIESEKIIKGAIFLLFGILIIFFLLSSINIIRDPYPLNYSDGIMVEFSELLLERGTYFLDINTLPAVYAPYPPVFIFIAAIFFKIFGSSFFIIRILSLLFSVILSMVVYRLIKYVTKDNFIALFFSLLFYVPVYMYSWLALGRADTLAILFAVAGLVVYIKEPKKLHSVIILFVLAFFTRQAVIAAAGAVFFDLWLVKKDAKKALSFLLMFGGSIAFIMFFFSILTKGQFYLHLISYNKMVFIIWEESITKYVRFIRPLSILFALAVYGLFSTKKNVFGFYFLINMLFLVTAGKNGASDNYFIEPFVSVLLYVGTMTRELFKNKEKRTAVFMLCLFLFQIISLMQNPRYYLNIVQKFIKPDYAKNEEILNLVKNSKGEVLSDNIGYLTMNDKKVWLEDPFYFNELAKAGVWDAAPLVEKCKNKQFSLILARYIIKELPGMNECLNTVYKKVGTVDDGSYPMDIYK